MIIFLVILISCLVGFIIYNKNIIKFDKNKTTIPTKQTNEKIEELITEYNLENIRDKIYSEEEFFLEFANTIILNENLREFKYLVFDLFEIIIDNKKNLEKDYFLSRLKNLSINEIEAEKMDAASGWYYSDIIEYSSLNDYYLKSTLHHELLHFLDDSIGQSREEYLYVCDDYYVFLSEYDGDLSEKCEFYMNDSGNIFSEGGAEKISSKYFYNNVNSTADYSMYVMFYNILSYIFEEDIIDNIFFSKNTTFELYNLLCIENGLSNKDFNTLMNSYAKNKIYSQVDKIIDIYYLKNNKKWYEDETLKKMIQSYLVFADDFDSSLVKGSKYELEYKKYINNKDVLKNIEKYINELESKNEKVITADSTIINELFTIISNKIYYIKYINYNRYEAEAYVIEYDFGSKKVINHQLYTFS